MTKTPKTAGIVVAASMVLVLVAALTQFVEFDRAGLLGAAIGAGLGLVNLAVSYVLAGRALKHGMSSTMGLLMGGFMARLILLVAGILWFQRLESIDATAFALTFMILFFVHVALEIQLVTRTLQGNGGTA